MASLHDERYQQFIELLVQRRKASGLSQQGVADALGWNQSQVAKIETCQRRIDVIELIRFADVIGIDASRLLSEVRKSMIGAGEISG
ncbi:MAG: helix-turn-helix domain-containing protein [Hyphomonadaceae bacterium]